MSIIRIRDPDEIRPVHVVMLVVVTLSLAANCWLTSAAEPTSLPDGAREWREDSLVLAIVELLNLNYAQPTPLGVAVKSLATMFAASIGVLIAGVVIAGRSGGMDRIEQSDTVINLQRPSDADPSTQDAKKHIDPVVAAQLMIVATIIWALASVLWSPSPDFAINAAVLFAAQATWPFALYVVLNRKMAQYATYVLIVILAITGLLAFLYHGERNPTLRASYPIGNPILLATYLGVGLTLSLAMLPQVAGEKGSKRAGRGAIRLVLALVVIAITGYAAYLSRSRGPMLGAVVGALSIPFLMLNRRAKIVVAGIALVGLTTVGGLALGNRNNESSTGRNTTIRVRLYAWSYALDLFRERPVTGFGQGGYTLQGDALAAVEVERDPAALMDRLSHTHNEWLQVGAELGVVGMVAMGGGLMLTLYAGGLAVSRRTGAERWILVGLIAALVSAVVAESAGVALRVEGFALVFYTLIGLIWVIAGRDESWVDVLSRRKIVAGIALVASIVVCLVFAEGGRRDFSTARASSDANKARENEQPAAAIELLQNKVGQRLRPVRRLAAMRQLAFARLEYADQLQSRCFRRVNMVVEGSGEGPLLGLANQDRAECVAQVEAGEELVRSIQDAAIDGFNTGWIDAGFKRIRAAFAQMDGDLVAANQHRKAAGAALAGQLIRNPFEPSLASAYVSTAAMDMELADIITTLAKPLRANRIPASYTAILSSIGQDPRFAELVDQIVSTAKNCALLDYDQWPDPWSPEKLRLVAVGQFATGDTANAIRVLEVADSLYAKLDRPATLAAASCKAERADALFYNDPFAPEKAIEAAELARRTAPNSRPGRALRSDIDDRIVTYHIAADWEERAREYALSIGRIEDQELIDAYLSDAYVGLGYGLFNVIARSDPERLDRWSKRAIELDGQAESGWFLAGDVALLTEDEGRAIECIRAVIERNADPNNVVAFLERARRTMPGSVAIKQISDQLRAQFNLPPEQPGAAGSPQP